MTFEKSCGAIVFRNERCDGELHRYVLMIKHSMNSNHSFPKGHVEACETERMTAAREVLEEHGIAASWEAETAGIINRRGDDICPIEKACANCHTAEECFDAIKAFLEKQK